MYIDLQPTTLIGRGYDTPDGYEKREPYKLVFSVSLIGDGEAYIHAMNGTQVTLALMGQLAVQLYEEYGIRTVTAERNGKKLTFGLDKIVARIRALEAEKAAKVEG